MADNIAKSVTLLLAEPSPTVRQTSSFSEHVFLPFSYRRLSYCFFIMIFFPGLIVALLLAFAEGSPRQEKGFSTLVDLGYSRYQGVRGGKDVTAWWGIRFAAPPVGDLRWRAPQEPLNTGEEVIAANTVRRASFFTSSCSMYCADSR